MGRPGLEFVPDGLPPLQKFFKFNQSVFIFVDELEAGYRLGFGCFWRDCLDKLDELLNVDKAVAIAVEKGEVLTNFFGTIVTKLLHLISGF